MKKTTLPIIIFLFIIAGRLAAQLPAPSPQLISPGGYFDQAFDRFGNKYYLQDLAIASPNSSALHLSLPTQSCSAGYFNVYFQPGSYWASSVSSQTTLCQLLGDISDFIPSPLSTTGARVNIYARDIPATSFTAALGVCSGIYILPFNPASPTPGIIDNLIYKSIISGQDPFTNFSAVGLAATGSSYYHGIIDINPNINWHTDTHSSSITGTEYDLYTTFLHEVMHSLGFASMISSTGYSNFGQANNYYGRFDKFLTDAGGTPLLSSGSCSGFSGLSYQAALSAIAPGACPSSPLTNGCSTGPRYAGSYTNVALYAPDCFRAGSSLSHFEDGCSTPIGYANSCSVSAVPPNSNTGLYYSMSAANGLGSCYVKRYIKEEERYALCDMGYSVNATYNSSAAGASHTYAGGACTTANTWGMNDGVVNGQLTYTAPAGVNTVSVPITGLNSILGNDAASASQISCLEVVYNNATHAISGSNLVVTANPNVTGLVLIKYLPQTSTGVLGGPAYIYVYFLPANCNPPNACNMVQNGGFENLECGQPYGFLTATNCYTNTIYPSLSCWDSYQVTPDLYTRNSTGSLFDLGVNTLNMSPPVESFNGSPNDRVVASFVGTLPGTAEILKNKLSSPLIPGQAYQLSMYILVPAGAAAPLGVYNPYNNPVVVTVASAPSFAFAGANFPAGLDVLVNFTVNTTNVWTAVTQTFVFTPAVTANHEAIIMGPNELAGADPFLSPTVYVFMDEVSLLPLASTPTFVIPDAYHCGNSNYTDLSQFASPIPGTFSGTGVIPINLGGGNIQYDFIAPGPGSYPVGFTYTTGGGCVNTIWQTIVVSSSAVTLSAEATPYCTNTGAPATISAACSAAGNYNYWWLPDNLYGATQMVTPAAATVYTVNILSNNCIVSQTLAVNLSSTCCNSTVTPLTGTVLPTITGGSHVFNTNVNVPNGATATLDGEFLFATGIKIIVNNGGHLFIRQAHLYACGSDMWQGIVVEDGGKLTAGDVTVNNRFNLVEDAITAIDISNHTTSMLTTILDIAYTTFNKNLTSINIANYQRSAITYSDVVKISNTIFTCRDLPFTATSWPTTGQSTPGNLRYETSPATGLASPYLGQSTYIMTNLKNPYSYRGSQTAVRVTGVGISSNNNYYGITIGDASFYHYFNLFDAHCTGIAAVNSNVKSTNNVFQNTRRYPAPVAPGSTLTAIEGGIGIESVFTNTMIGNLDLQATSAGTGNRFWNCHTGISGKKLYGFDIRYATFRSTQNRFTMPNPYGDPGNMAINLNTSKFKYYMYSNEFTNIKNAINIPIVAGPMCFVCAPGIYAANITVLQNTFSPGTGTGNYMSQAVNITCANGAPVTIAPSTLPGGPGGSFATGLMIEYNQLNDVLRGIYVQGITGFRTFINKNKVSLLHDDSYANQHGIDLSNHKDGGISTGVGQIIANTVIGSAETMDNTQASLVYNSLNQGICSPSISCNEVKNSYQGFVFSGLNTVLTSFWGTRWLSNKMEDLKRGMVLTNLGRIGQQGAGNYGTGNSWNGTWTGNNGIYTENSYANQSKLYISGSTAPAFPPNLDGNPFSDSYGNPTNNSILTTSVASFFSCSEPEQFIEPDPVKDPNYGSANVAYMANMGLYWLVKHNDSIKAANGELSDFYTSLEGSNIDLLSQTEEHLYAGNYLMARAILSSMTTDNIVESNYKSFYALYANYQQSIADSSDYSPADSTALNDLAELCPAYNGACIYQARALYNGIYNTVSNYKDCLDPGKARLTHYGNDQLSTDAPQSLKTWDVNLFPNPAKDQLNIVSKTANEKLHITILDLTGRTIMQQDLKASGFIANLGLSLTNGAYIITISNQDKKTITKKLIIAE